MSKASIFSSEQLDKIVADTMPADAKPGEKVVIGTLDQHGAQVMASFKLQKNEFGGPSWELQAAARHEWTGENSVGAKVLLRW